MCRIKEGKARSSWICNGSAIALIGLRFARRSISRIVIGERDGTSGTVGPRAKVLPSFFRKSLVLSDRKSRVERKAIVSLFVFLLSFFFYRNEIFLVIALERGITAAAIYFFFRQRALCVAVLPVSRYIAVTAVVDLQGPT